MNPIDDHRQPSCELIRRNGEQGFFVVSRPCPRCGETIIGIAHTASQASEMIDNRSFLCHVCDPGYYDRLFARIKVLRAMRYSDYLKTPEWQARRAATLEADGFACRVCSSTDRLNVHHRTYERRGEESAGDVITLCQRCHQLFHKNGKLAKPEG